MVFPPGVGKSTLRTNSTFRATCVKIDEMDGDGHNPEETNGITLCSPLLKLPCFDMVCGLPTEYMHLVALGVVKKVLSLLLGIRKDGGLPKNKQKALVDLNKSLRAIRTPSEFSRRTRDLKLAHWKAEEYRNMLLFFFPCLLPHLESKDERTLWLLLVFAVRAYVLPREEYKSIQRFIDVPTVVNRFYGLFHKLFKSKGCSYNIHVFSHLPLLHQHGPLTSTSAFRFESFLAVLKDSFRVGTPNVTKQIFENLFLSMAVKKHSCRPSLTFKAQATARSDDTLLRANNNWYICVLKTHEGVLCKALNTEPAYFEMDNEVAFNFGHVGVYCDLGISDDAEQLIFVNDISGKGIRVAEYIVYCPYNVAFEC